jgi:hypothetical protein
LILSLAIGIYCAAQTYEIYRGLEHRADYLYWDPAAHAWYGARIALAVRSIDILSLLSTVNEQVLWPPLHSLLQLPFQLILGPGFRAASICSFVFLALTFPALAFLYQQFERDGENAGGAAWAGWFVLMTFTASSPYYAGFGSMPMLEIFGAAFTAFSAALFLRHSRWFPASLALLFFLKYNYCLYLLMPILFLHAIEWIRQDRLREFWRERSSFQWFVAVYLACLAAIFVTGGFRIGKLSVRGIGNPLYILLLIVVGRAMIRRQFIDAWRRIRGTGWEWFAVPVLLWLLIPVPNRVRTLVSFAVNAPLSGHSPAEASYYTFYFRALSVYFSTWWLGGMCLAGAAACAFLLRRNRSVRFAFLLFVLAFLLMTLNQNKQERFLFTFTFALWILCSFAVSRIPQAVVRAGIAAALALLCVNYYDIRTTREQVAWPFVPLSVEEPVQFLSKQTAGAENARILGASNEMSPALLAFHVARASGSANRPRLGWDLEKAVPAGTRICGINMEVPGGIIATRDFPGYRITCTTMENAGR